MMSGLMARSASYPSPQLSRTPGEKPSATTSDIATSRRAISRPFGCLTFSEMPRLPGFLLLNCPPMSGSVTPGSGPVARSRAARPPTGAIAAMRVSGWLFSSTSMLSAPNALRNLVPPAEARNHVKSRMRMLCSSASSTTRMPVRGPRLGARWPGTERSSGAFMVSLRPRIYPVRTEETSRSAWSSSKEVFR